jgi:hypothetical protein
MNAALAKPIPQLLVYSGHASIRIKYLVQRKFSDCQDDCATIRRDCDCCVAQSNN